MRKLGFLISKKREILAQANKYSITTQEYRLNIVLILVQPNHNITTQEYSLNNNIVLILNDTV